MGTFGDVLAKGLWFFSLSMATHLDQGTFGDVVLAPGALWSNGPPVQGHAVAKKKFPPSPLAFGDERRPRRVVRGPAVVTVFCVWTWGPLRTFGASPPLRTEGPAFLLTAEQPPVYPHHH